MTNHDLSTLLIECADELHQYRAEMTLDNTGYDKVKTLERRAREAAVEVMKSRELNPLEDDLK